MSKSKKNKLLNAVNPNKIKHFAWIIAIVIFLGVATRFLTWPSVVTDNIFQLKGADAYYFVREAQNIENGGIPKLDPMFCAATGLQTDSNALLYSQIVAFFGHIAPIETITALSGPFFGGFTILFVFFIIRELFPDNDWAVVAGTAIASLTGIQFIARSYFGFGARTTLETFFMSLSLLAIIKTIRKISWKWAILSVIAFILYTFTWAAASLMITFISLAVVVQILFDDFNKKRVYYLLGVYLILMIVGKILGDNYLFGGSLATLAGLIFITALTIKFDAIKTRVMIFLSTLFIGFILTWIFAPNIVNIFFNFFQGFLFPNGIDSMISEYQPMFTIYQTWYNPLSKAGVQVFIHVLTAVAFILMIRKKNYLMAFLGVCILVISFAKIRGEYYLLIINAISIPYLIGTNSKKFAYFIIGVAVYFSILYWGDQVINKQNSSLVFADYDYKMASWMKSNLPEIGIPLTGDYKNSPVPNYWVLARWDLGYLYGYLADKPLYSAPNLCNYQTPAQILDNTNEDTAFNKLQGDNIKYVIVKFGSFAQYYTDEVSLGGTPPEFLHVSNNGTDYYFSDGSYYQTVQSKLFNFDGQAYIPSKVYYVKNDTIEQTDNYFQGMSLGDDHKTYSPDPLSAPVPIAPLKHFKLLHTEGTGVNAVKLYAVIN